MEEKVKSYNILLTCYYLVDRAQERCTLEIFKYETVIKITRRSRRLTLAGLRLKQ